MGKSTPAMTDAVVHCASCGRDNRADRRFCTNCGSRLVAVCTQCGTPGEPGEQFCGQCGTRVGNGLAAALAPAREPVEVRGVAKGERRQLTVLFCDLVGSTRIAAQLDPEEWRDIAAHYQRTAAAAVTRYGGHVAKYLGDGLVVFFGWPQAHEDDAERAVRAGLAVVEAVRGLSVGGATQQSAPLQVRVGIHTGPVVVGQGGGDALDVFGGTPNIAARVQSIAEPDAVLVTAATQRLVAGQFIVDEPRAEHVKGVREAVVVYRVHRPAGVRGRLAAAAPSALTPFVGRQHERQLLMERWEQAQDGDGQLVVIVGEPGMGKSRLVRQFKADLNGVPHSWVETAGSPYHADSPFYLVREAIVQLMASWCADTALEARLDTLAEMLEVVGLKSAEAMPLIAPLIDLALPAGRYPPVLLAPEQQRRRLLATLVEWIVAGARLQPNVMVIEDVHWADPSTLEMLALLAEQCAKAPLLLITTARPEFSSPWPLRAHHTHVTLSRLTKGQVRQMIANVASRGVPPQDTLNTLIARADGVPLFVEELTRAVIESAGGGIASHEVPATLQDGLMARLDRLTGAKDVAQIAAVIGREFPYALLRDVVAASHNALLEDELGAALQRLVDAELVYARGVPPEATYNFKHALIHETAYASLLKSHRRELHKIVATVLTETCATLAETQPEIAAQHWEAAAEADRAVAAWQDAAERARDRGANVEAERYYRRAIEVLCTQPDTPARAQQELMLRLPLGYMVGMTRGYGSTEMLDCQARARELGEQLGDRRQMFTILHLAWASVFTRGDLRAALSMAGQLLEAAEREGSTFTRSYAHYAQGITRYMSGDIAAARHEAERALTYYREEEHREWPGEAGVMARGLLACALGEQGLGDHAYAEVDALLGMVPRLESPSHRAFAYQQVIAALGYMRDVEGVFNYTERLAALIAEQQISLFDKVGRSQHGWALAMRGEPERGIAELREGIEAAWQRPALGLWLGRLAEAQLLAGRWDEGLASVEQGLAAAPEERLHIPELLRVRGELLRRIGERAQSAAERRGAEDEAERFFREAILPARAMGAKLDELRATTSLGRLFRSQGRTAEVCAVLEPVYGSFTEGFGTRDLREAKALLDDVRAGA